MENWSKILISTSMQNHLIAFQWQQKKITKLRSHRYERDFDLENELNDQIICHTPFVVRNKSKKKKNIKRVWYVYRRHEC